MTPRALLLVALLGVPGTLRVTRSEPPLKVAVLSIELNNLHKTAPDSSLAGRIQGVEAALVARLATTCGYHIVPIDSTAQAAAQLGQGYLYDRPDVAAGLAAAAGADLGSSSRVSTGPPPGRPTSKLTWSEFATAPSSAIGSSS
jgi:hypothetical protein